jgi:hypothetical protein
MQTAREAAKAGPDRRQARTFENNPDGWKRLLAWLKAMGDLFGRKAARLLEACDKSCDGGIETHRGQ